ncbi:MAG: transporter substrate-binding domain-containing protein, partial [Gammaproteobacteria bacterium]|nr:transporter substrate-binding domain-containing protein [Gammaproteobacteria bacterium]
MKRTFIAVLMLSFALFLTGCNRRNNNGVTTEGVLVVGMECDYQPFNWTETEKSDSNVEISNIKGAYANGYDVMIAKRIAEALNLELQIKALSWEGLIPALNAGEIDLIIAGMSPTEERKQTIAFSSSYYTSTHVLLMRNDSNYRNATTLSGFSGARVIGQSGTIYADLVPQVVEKGGIAGTNLDTVPQIVNAILRGTVDITILEEPVAIGIVSNYHELTYVTPTDGFNVSEEDVVVSIGVRQNFSLLNDINN